jgi:hypothetical protein
MSYWFGDSFDLYKTDMTEAVPYFWDASSLNPNQHVFATGRFIGSRSINCGTSSYMIKSSGANDSVHHINLAVYNSQSPSTSTNIGFYVTFYDGATAQCTVGFRLDNTIVFAQGAPNGTVLAVTPPLMLLNTTWYGLEIEVVVHNTTGSIAIRRNGNTTNDFFLGGLDTAATANNYANAIRIGAYNSSGYHYVDDFLWRSDVASVPWLGEARCYTRMPLSDVSVQWTKSGAVRTTAITGGSGYASVQDRSFYGSFVMPCDGTVSAVSWYVATSTYTGSLKCALFNDSGSNTPSTVIQQASNIITAPPTASIYYTFNFIPPVTVTAGQKIWLGVCQSNGSGGNITAGTGGSSYWFTDSVTYATFPVANPGNRTVSGSPQSSISVTPTWNASLVNEAPQDLVVSYVSSSTNGQADFYTLGPSLSVANAPPVTVVGVTTRGYFTKTDAGTRNVAVQLKSGATTVGSASTALPSNVWNWVVRSDAVDPNTGSAWTAAAVDALNVGPVVTA